MHSEPAFALPQFQGTDMTSHEQVAEPMAIDFASTNTVLSEASPPCAGAEPPLSEGSQSDCDSDCDDLLATPPSSTHPLSWATAAHDALEGIHYVREKFPNDNTTYVPTPFRKEPLFVEEGDRVHILDEVSEFIIRVRLLRTNIVGVLPMWNVEGALERLARQNMELNGIVTCPEEVARRSGAPSPSSSPVPHEHEHCSAAIKKRAVIRRDSMDEDDIDFPLTPTSPLASFPQKLQQSTRKVGFTDISTKKIFRYIPPRDADDQWDSDSDEADDGESVSSDDGDTQWWWDGWEESHDAKASASVEEEESEDDLASFLRPGRLRIRRPNPVAVTL